MRITPLDIQQKQYKRVWRGLDPEDVAQFSELVRTEFEELVKENNALKDELRRRMTEIDDYREREKTLKDTMMTAQKISEDIKINAKKDAELTLSEAQVQADRIIQGAHARLVVVVEEINELKRQRIQFESQVKSVIEAHTKLLETFATSEEERERIDPTADNLAFLTRKVE